MARCDPTVLSLFTGAGGLDIGLEAAGFRTAVSVEMSPACVATLKANRSWPIVAKDIHDAPTEEILAAGGLESGEVDLLAAGPPCQPFSKAGYWATGEASRLEDLRASTLDATLRVIRGARPRTILIENVDAIGYSGKSEGLRRIIGGIERINEETGTRYSPVHEVLDSAWYGAPQHRRRLIVVANRDGRRISLPRPTHGPKADLEGLEPHRTAWDALGDLGEPEEEGLETTGRWADLLPSVPEGRNYLWHTDRGGGIPLFGWRRRYWSFLLKLAKDRPAWTISAEPGPATGPFHWQNRQLSMRELCRLQTFPDGYHVLGNRREVQRQLGNAVPSLLAEVIGRAILSQGLDRSGPNGPPSLLPRRRKPLPDPEPVKTVPSRYLELRGEHPAHPGEGLGPRAQALAAAVA